MDTTFYEKFYSNMNPSTFYALVRATPADFQFSVKVPETVTHQKRMDAKKGAIDDLKEFLNKITHLKEENKLGAMV